MTRVLVPCVLAAAFASGVWAGVSVDVYSCDGQTPLAPLDSNVPHVYRDIMVGTRLVLVVRSTAGGPWSGSLDIMRDDWDRGGLVGRGFNPDSLTLNYEGSCLQAAGDRSTVSFYEVPLSLGFDLQAHRTAVAGDWFVLDYHAWKAGPCNVDLYDYGLAFDVPVATHAFNHVPSRDYDGDGIVNFYDFGLFSRSWRRPAGALQEASDLNGDARVDIGDLILFSDYWLERADCNEVALE